jgi:hypothetical protein
MFAGYDAFCGLPVVVGRDPQTATARTDRFGQKYIHIDPGAMGNWTASRVFVLAHECAHHLLGHTSPLGAMERFSGGTAKQELEADCWAARQLRRAGLDFEITRTVLQNASQGHFAAGGYPSGRRRALNVSRCAGGRREPRCRVVQVPEEYTDYETRYQPARTRCTHCGCNQWGQCGCMHAFDEVPQRVRVPVRRTRYVSKRVCD